MKNPILIPELREMLRKRRFKLLQSFIEEAHPREVAEYLGLLRPSEIWKIINLTDVHTRAGIFSYLDLDVQADMVSGSTRKNIAELMKEMSHDDRADLIQRLDRDVADRILLLMPVSERADVIQLTSYQEETAGAIMTTDYALVNENDTVEKSIRKMRREAPSKETIYYMYVTDDEGKLIGFVSLRKLILAGPKQKIGSVMKRDVIFGFVDDDQETVARAIDEYDLLALPIVDRNERMVGIITYDDAIDILREEQTEDLEKLMAISGGVEEKGYLDVSSLVHFRKRVFWVVTLGIFGLLTGLIVEVFQDTLQKLIILSFYMPLLNAAGGNTGSQSATVILRSLTLNELRPSDLLKVLSKEFIISFLLALCLGFITFGRVYFLPAGSAPPPEFSMMAISVTIALSLGLQVLWSTMFGAFVPIAATKLKLDPALVSSPLLTTFVDMGGIIIYFTSAKLILGV